MIALFIEGVNLQDFPLFGRWIDQPICMCMSVLLLVMFNFNQSMG